MNETLINKTFPGWMSRIERDVQELQRRMGKLPDRLGGTAYRAADLNEALDSGFYSTGASTLNRPPVASSSHVVEVISYSDTAKVQTAYGVGGAVGIVYRRYMVGGAWQAWILLSMSLTTVAPTFSGGFTLGNGTASMRYSVTDGNAYVALDVICGSTTTMTGDMMVGMPVPMASGVATVQAGNGRMILRGRNYHLATLASGTNLYIRMLQDVAAITPPVGQQPAPAGIVQMEMSAFSPIANDRVTGTFVYPVS